MSAGVYAPSVQNLHDIRDYRYIMGNTTTRLLGVMNTENTRFRLTATNTSTAW